MASSAAAAAAAAPAAAEPTATAATANATASTTATATAVVTAAASAQTTLCMTSGEDGAVLSIHLEATSSLDPNHCALKADTVPQLRKLTPKVHFKAFPTCSPGANIRV